MAFLAADDIQDWLEPTKLTITNLDDGISEYARSTVFGRLAASYSTTSWTNTTTTPSVVVQMCAMLAAAAVYRKAYSEDLVTGAGLNWAEWLETTVAGMLTDIASGVSQIPELETGDAGLKQPSFWPTDDSSLTDPAKFTMAAIF